MAHNNLGAVLRDLKRFDEAEKACREAIRLDPEDSMAHNNLKIMLNKSDTTDST